MQYGIEVVHANMTDAEVMLPTCGITVTFRCPKNCAPTPALLFEVARMQPSGRLEEPIRVSAWALENMRTTAAAAIAQKRSAEATTMQRRVLPFQLPFSFR